MYLVDKTRNSPLLMQKGKDKSYQQCWLVPYDKWPVNDEASKKAWTASEGLDQSMCAWSYQSLT